MKLFSETMSLISFVLIILVFEVSIVKLELNYNYRLLFTIFICLIAPFSEWNYFTYVYKIYRIFTNIYQFKIIIIIIFLLIVLLLDYISVSKSFRTFTEYLYKLICLDVSLILSYIISILLYSGFFRYIRFSNITIKSYGFFHLYLTLLDLFILSIIIFIIIYISSIMLFYLFNLHKMKKNHKTLMSLLKKRCEYYYSKKILSINITKHTRNSYFLSVISKLEGAFEIIILFVIYAFIYISNMEIVLDYKYGKYFHVNLTNSVAESDIKVIALDSMAIPIIVMLLVILFYSWHFVRGHKYMNKSPLIYDMFNSGLSAGIKAFGILFMILSILGIRQDPNSYMKMLPVIIMIVSGLLTAYTLQVIVHEQFIDKDKKYCSKGNWKK